MRQYVVLRTFAIVFVAVLLASPRVSAADGHAGRSSDGARADPALDGNREPVDPGEARRRNAKIAAASGIALVGASLAVSIFAKIKYDRAVDRLEAIEQAPMFDEAAHEAARDDANDAHRLARYGGTTLFVGGTLALGVATVLYLTAPSKPTTAPSKQMTSIAPTTSRSFTGVTLTRQF